MHIKSEVFIQTLQKSQDRHKISFAFEFNNKNTKKVFGANLPPPNTIQLDLPPNTIRVKLLSKENVLTNALLNLFIKYDIVNNCVSPFILNSPYEVSLQINKKNIKKNEKTSYTGT